MFFIYLSVLFFFFWVVEQVTISLEGEKEAATDKKETLTDTCHEMIARG